METALNLMKWPLLACLLLPGILVYYGLHIVRREVVFVDLALAQVAALGTCVAVLLGYDVRQWQTFAWGIGFTFVGAVVFTLTRRLPWPAASAPTQPFRGLGVPVAGLWFRGARFHRVQPTSPRGPSGASNQSGTVSVFGG